MGRNILLYQQQRQVNYFAVLTVIIGLCGTFEAWICVGATDPGTTRTKLECYECSFQTNAAHEPGGDAQDWCYVIEKSSQKLAQHLTPHAGNDVYGFCKIIRGLAANGTTVYIHRTSLSVSERGQMDLLKDGLCTTAIPKGIRGTGAVKWFTCHCDDRNGCNDDGLRPHNSATESATASNAVAINGVFLFTVATIFRLFWA